MKKHTKKTNNNDNTMCERDAENVDFANPVGLKNRLINHFLHHFDTKYQENSSQNWRM